MERNAARLAKIIPVTTSHFSTKSRIARRRRRHPKSKSLTSSLVSLSLSNSSRSRRRMSHGTAIDRFSRDSMRLRSPLMMSPVMRRNRTHFLRYRGSVAGFCRSSRTSTRLSSIKRLSLSELTKKKTIKIKN